MHDHNNHDSKMMWWMAIGCGLPILLLLFMGESASSGWFKWAVLGALLFMIMFHIFGMSHGKKEDSGQSNESKLESAEDSEHHH